MSKSKGIRYALLVMLLWGALFPLIKLGYTAYQITTTGDILFFAGLRFSLCGALICLYRLVTKKETYRSAGGALLPILLSGFFAIILHYGFTYLGLSMTDSSKAAILKQIGVLFYVCFSFLFFKEDLLTARKLIAAALGFLGVLAINFDNSRMTFTLGDLLIVLASFCTVFSNVISKKILKTVDSITMTGLSHLFGGVVLLIAGLSLGGSMNFSFDKAYILVLICLASVFSYCIWFGIVKTAELSQLFIIKFAEPVFACLFAAVLLREEIFKVQYFVAFALISAGIVLANIPKKPAAPKENQKTNGTA